MQNESKPAKKPLAITKTCKNIFNESLKYAKTFKMSNSSISQSIQILLFSAKSQIISTTGKDENESQIKLRKSIYATSAYDWTKEQNQNDIPI